jgi:hypothetical protein
MAVVLSFFWEPNLPNPVTWFYFSVLLAVALFFKFWRLLSIRNLDIVTLFLFVPGLLLLLPDSGGTDRWGFVWLLAASGYFLVRCILDLGLSSRPALAPNLSLGGLFWLAGSLFVGLVAVRMEPPRSAREQSEPPPPTPLEKGAKPLVEKTAAQIYTGPDLGPWVERGLALLCHASIVVGLILIGRKHFDDLTAGTAAAVLYLLLPYTFLMLPHTQLETSLKAGRWDHAWPMAWMIWSVLAYRRPALAGVFLGIAAGTAYFPLFVIPAWIGFYWRRGALRFGMSCLLTAGLCLALLAICVKLNHGEMWKTLQSPWNQSTWQPWQEPVDARSVWGDPSKTDTMVHWAYRAPIFLAFIAFVTTTSFWPRPKDLAHVLALSAAVLIGIQFWYADQGGVYILWYLPFLVLLVFRPNLTACIPPPPTDDWLAHLGRRLGRWLASWTHRRQPEPAQT